MKFMLDRDVTKVIPISLLPMDPLELAELCGGHYLCPKDASGSRMGPLVGYAGRYGDDQLQWVGDEYYDFAKVEQYPHVLQKIAVDLFDPNKLLFDKADVFCGAPEGGKAFAEMLALMNRRRYLYPEKVSKLIAVGAKPVTELTFSRHALRTGDTVILVEDVCNNFSTTDKLVSLILSQGGQVIAIVCILNRSTTVEGIFTPSAGPEIPVIAAARKLIDEYHQDDPRVAEDILNRNVVWDAKPNWSLLMEVMQGNKGR